MKKRQLQKRMIRLESLEERTLLAVMAGMVPAFPTAEDASTIVTTCEDVVNGSDNVISLREAIQNANDGGTITFDSSLSGGTITIDASLGEIVIPKSVTINASALESGITIDANQACRVFYVEADMEVSINGLTITGGNAVGEGGGIMSNGQLTVTNSVICGNSASGNGGGIANAGDYLLTLNNCVVDQNTASGSGGGVWGYESITLINCSVTNNTAGGYGGGVYGTSNCGLTFRGCDVSGNTSSGDGGGVAAFAWINMNVTSVTNNHSRDGGGVELRGRSELQSCVISGNVARYGGGVEVTGSPNVIFVNCTIAGNASIKDGDGRGDGGGIQNEGSVRLENTIVAGNYVSDSSCSTITGEYYSNGGKILVDVDPFFAVAPVFDNDGVLTNADTLDLSLTEQSLNAIDQGDSEFVDDSVDVAGDPRFVASYKPLAAVDIGAYEYQFVLPEEADPIVVTTLEDTTDPDDGLLSLREALNLASGDRVVFDSSLNGGTISLQQGSLYYNKLRAVIDASDLSDGITIDAHEDSGVFYFKNNSVVELYSLTITGGVNHPGGGIYVDSGASLTMADCAVTNCVGSQGGGIYINSGASFTMTDCVVKGNSTTGSDGGGIFINGYSTATIVNSLIFGNSARDGVGVEARGTLLMMNCVVAGNVGRYGAGVETSETSNGTIINCTIAGNSSFGNDGRGGVAVYNSGILNIYNTIVAENYGDNNAAQLYGEIGGSNNFIDGTPGFTVAPVFDGGNLVNGDSLDLSLVEGSAAIDAGNNDYVQTETDFAGNPRISHGIVDIGAYEYQQDSPVEPLAAPTISAVASAGANRQSVSWDAVEGAIGYELTYSPDQENWSRTISTTDTSYVVTGLTYGDLVYYKVKAVGDGASYSDSDWSEAKSLYVCPMDINGDKIISGADLTILSKAWFARPTSANWDARADVDGSGMINGSDLTWLSTNWLKRASSQDLSYPPEKAQIFADADFDALDVDCDFALDADVDVF